MAKSPPGYLLPAGDAFTDEMACALVFYPDKPEYRRALYGSLVYLSNWLAWERDPDKRGQDAARAWKDATELTLECMNMACLEELLADVEAIRILMENKKDCCDDNVDYYPPDPPEIPFEPFVGDPPEFYGETEISDWDDWAEHVCYNANKYVDYLKDTAEQLQESVSISSIFIGIIGATLALLAFSGLLLAVPYALAAAVVAGIVLLATSTTFSDTSDDFETARQLIVCAIINGWQLSETIESALSSGTDWDLFYQFVDYDSALAIIFEGGYNEEYLPSEIDDTCGCEVFEHLVFEWPTDLDGFDGFNIITEWDAGEFIKCEPANHNQWKSDYYWTWADLAVRFGLSLPVQMNQLRFKFQNNSGTGVAHRHLFEVRSGSDVLGWMTTGVIDTDDFEDDVWHEVIYNHPATWTSGEHGVNFKIYTYDHVEDGQRLFFDDVGIYLR